MYKIAKRQCIQW